MLGLNIRKYNTSSATEHEVAEYFGTNQPIPHSSDFQDTSYYIFRTPSKCDWRSLDEGIAFTNWQITLLDSTRKKTTFVNDLITKLKLSNAIRITTRAETLGRIIPGDRPDQNSNW